MKNWETDGLKIKMYAEVAGMAETDDGEPSPAGMLTEIECKDEASLDKAIRMLENKTDEELIDIIHDTNQRVFARERFSLITPEHYRSTYL
jgi:hypothetical protein